MEEKKEKKRIIKKLKAKYRLIIYNDTTFEEVWFMRLSRLNMFSFVGIIVILFTAIVTVIIAFTPIREFIPGYPDQNMRRNIILNAIKVDSLEYELQLKDQYFMNLKTIIEGKEPNSFESLQDSNIIYDDIIFTKSKPDTILYKQIEKDQQYNLSVFEDKKSNNKYRPGFPELFFPPIRGLITRKFNSSENHFGTDIVAAPNEAILATLDGTIILANWTLETGYIISIQHENNLVSVYKHLAEKLKSPGTYVQAGEPIGIFGNSGDLSTGPHLHFELWHNQTPIDPEDYIVF